MNLVPTSLPYLSPAQGEAEGLYSSVVRATARLKRHAPCSLPDTLLVPHCRRRRWCRLPRRIRPSYPRIVIALVYLRQLLELHDLVYPWECWLDDAELFGDAARQETTSQIVGLPAESLCAQFWCRERDEDVRLQSIVAGWTLLHVPAGDSIVQ